MRDEAEESSPQHSRSVKQTRKKNVRRVCVSERERGVLPAVETVHGSNTSMYMHMCVDDLCMQRWA